MVKQKYGLFSGIITLYNSSDSKLSEFVLEVCPQTKALRRRRYWLIAASTIDRSNCAHSSIRCVLSSSTSTILERYFRQQNTPDAVFCQINHISVYCVLIKSLKSLLQINNYRYSIM